MESKILVENKKPTIDDVVRRHGLSVDDLVRCGKGGLEATRQIKDRDGDLVEEVPDWNVRHKFFSSFLELLGYINGPGTTVNVGATEEKKEAEAAYKRWRELGN